MPDTSLDPLRWPKWKHHPTRESVLVTTPDDEAALSGEYRDTPYSAAEKAAWADQVRQAAAGTLAQIEADMTRPVVPRRRR